MRTHILLLLLTFLIATTGCAQKEVNSENLTEDHATEF